MTCAVLTQSDYLFDVIDYPSCKWSQKEEAETNYPLGNLIIAALIGDGRNTDSRTFIRRYVKINVFYKCRRVTER